MMKHYFLIVFYSFSFYGFSQSVTIAKQNFDEPNLAWNFTTDIPFFDNGTDGFYGIHNGDNDNDPNDTGIAIKGNSIIYENITGDFLFINDLSDEGNNGTNQEAIVSFNNIDISAYHGVFITFDYEIIQFDTTDYIKYELIEDGTSSEIITLPKNEFESLTIPVNNKTKNLIFNFIIKQNGITDFAAIDNIELRGTPNDPCSEIMISEYVEGTSSTSHRNNFIELYNPTSTDIDLENYDLVKYTGANLNISGALNISGIIPSFGSFVIEDKSETIGINADLSTTSTVMDFTGNSKIALRNSTNIIDIIGVIGEEGNFAKDITLRRKSNIQIPNNQYDPEEWDVYGLEDTSNLTSHVSFCSGPIPEIEIYGNSIEIIDGAISSSTSNNTYFGDIDPSSGKSILKSFIIRNSGNEILEVNNIELIESNPSEFSLLGETSITINPKDSITFQIQFKPTTTGIKTVTVNINNSDASENPFHFIIQGEGSGFSNSPVMITQYYEGAGNNKWLEITNITNEIIPENTYYLALYWNDDANNTIGNKPSRSKEIPALLPGETLKYSSTLPVAQPAYAINDKEIKTSVCSFTGDDIVLISRTNDETCWANKVDIIGNSNNWGANISLVRKYGCENVNPKTGFDINDWFIYEILQVNSISSGLNPRIGEHYSGSTSYESSNSWSNGIPDLNRNVTINSNYDTAKDGNFESCNLIIKETKILNIGANSYISIKNDLTVNGTLEVEHEGSLHMANDFGVITNSGVINIHKTTTRLKKFDFTYWSSPVSNAILEDVFSASPQNSFYRFNTQTFNDLDNDGVDDENNDWQRATGTMEIGKAYTAMAPDLDPFIDKQSVIFSGKVNNGIVKVPLHLSEDILNDFDDWNLIGNPYPSALDTELLLNNLNNQALISGTIYLWTHNTSLQSDGDLKKYSSNDYAMYNVGTGGIAAVSQGVEPTQYIASGQGFFVEANQISDLEFNNSMRVKLNNTNFFKQNESKNKVAVPNKIWLNLYNDQGAFSQILIGFIEGASASYELKYDGLRFVGSNFLSFYSFAEEQRLAIQGTSLFSENTVFDLGYTANIEEEITLKIGIDHIEGILQKKDVFLHDRLLNKTHDLNLADYTFVSKNKGSFDNRFVLKFNEEIIEPMEDELVKEQLILKNEGSFLTVKTSRNTIISSIIIYDLLGRRINEVNTNTSNVMVDSSTFKRGNILIMRAKLIDSRVFIKKFIR